MSESKGAAERNSDAAPEFTATAVHRALDAAISGIGPFPGAAELATKAHNAHHGDEVASVRTVIETHVRLAAAQGLMTNLGGLLTATLAVPANIAVLAFLQCRMAAAILHLRGYDLADPRVHNAILAALLGEERLMELLSELKVPTTPMAMATAPVADPRLGFVMANEVAAELVTRVAGKRLATTAARRTPLVGGVFGAGADGYLTWRAGRYVDREFLSRRRR